MRSVGLAAAGLWLGLAPAAYAAPDPAIPDQVSEKLIADFSRADLDALAADATNYMGSGAAAKIKTDFGSIKSLGQSQYTDLVYSRDYGTTEKDIIYKVDFDKAFVFVRFLWHVDSANWRLVNFVFKSEVDLPFPKDWGHIYPK